MLPSDLAVFKNEELGNWLSCSSVSSDSYPSLVQQSFVILLIHSC